jgi:hypothetical protein
MLQLIHLLDNYRVRLGVFFAFLLVYGPWLAAGSSPQEIMSLGPEAQDQKEYCLMTEDEKREYRISQNHPASLDGLDPEYVAAIEEGLQLSSTSSFWSVQPIRAMSTPLRPPWVELVQRLGESRNWGFVGYRGYRGTDEEWEEIREKFMRVASVPFEEEWARNEDPDGVRNGATIVWKEGVFNGNDDVRAYVYPSPPPVKTAISDMTCTPATSGLTTSLLIA